MLTTVDMVPEKGLLKRTAHRVGILDAFLASGMACAEFKPESGDDARRAYNGLLMAIRRGYAHCVEVCWRRGRVYLRRVDGAGEARR